MFAVSPVVFTTNTVISSLSILFTWLAMHTNGYSAVKARVIASTVTISILSAYIFCWTRIYFTRTWNIQIRMQPTITIALMIILHEEKIFRHYFHLLRHEVPLPMKPDLQVHVKPPFVLMQLALEWQLWV